MGHGLVLDASAYKDRLCMRNLFEATTNLSTVINCGSLGHDLGLAICGKKRNSCMYVALVFEISKLHILTLVCKF